MPFLNDYMHDYDCYLYNDVISLEKEKNRAKLLQLPFLGTSDKHLIVDQESVPVPGFL